MTATVTATTREVRPDNPGDRVVLVHDYLTQRGGAERVALVLTHAFPEAPLVTSLYDPLATYPEFRLAHVEPLPVNRLSVLRHNHKVALPLLAPSFSAVTVNADVVVCSSSGWAHGIRTDGRKLVYCHTPARWLYEREDYLLGYGRAARWTMRALHGSLVRCAHCSE